MRATQQSTYYNRFLQFKKGPFPSIVSCLELASTPGHPSPSGGSAMSSYSFNEAPFRLLWPALDTAAMARAERAKQAAANELTSAIPTDPVATLSICRRP